MFAEDVKVGDVFTRTDKNGKIWEAKVINRTEYFVDVEKTHPYQIKVANEDISGQFGCWHYEDAPKTYERCEIIPIKEYVCVGKRKSLSLFGGEHLVDDMQWIPTGDYAINVKEDFSKYPQYDKTYKLIKNKKEI